LMLRLSGSPFRAAARAVPTEGDNHHHFQHQISEITLVLSRLLVRAPALCRIVSRRLEWLVSFDGAM
jgi:hypothetical protein